MTVFGGVTCASRRQREPSSDASLAVTLKRERSARGELRRVDSGDASGVRYSLSSADPPPPSPSNTTSACSVLFPAAAALPDNSLKATIPNRPPTRPKTMAIVANRSMGIAPFPRQRPHHGGRSRRRQEAAAEAAGGGRVHDHPVRRDPHRRAGVPKEEAEGVSRAGDGGPQGIRAKILFQGSPRRRRTRAGVGF